MTLNSRLETNCLWICVLTKMQQKQIQHSFILLVDMPPMELYEKVIVMHRHCGVN